MKPAEHVERFRTLVADLRVAMQSAADLSASAEERDRRINAWFTERVIVIAGALAGESIGQELAQVLRSDRPSPRAAAPTKVTATPEAARVSSAGELFYEIASLAIGLRELLHMAISEEVEVLPGALSMACHLGALADWGAGACGATRMTGDKGWLLSPGGVEALDVLRGVPA